MPAKLWNHLFQWLLLDFIYGDHGGALCPPNTVGLLVFFKINLIIQHTVEFSWFRTWNTNKFVLCYLIHKLRNILLATNSWEQKEVIPRVGIDFFFPENVKCLLKELSSSRGDRMPWDDILFSHTVFSLLLLSPPPPLHSLPLSEHRLTLGQPRSAFSHLSAGHGPLSSLPWCPSSFVHTELWLPSLSPVALNGCTSRSGVQLTIQGAAKNETDWKSCC